MFSGILPCSVEHFADASLLLLLSIGLHTCFEGIVTDNLSLWYSYKSITVASVSQMCVYVTVLISYQGFWAQVVWLKLPLGAQVA